MAISQNFPDEGPTLNLNFAGGKVLDPRITFIRSSVGTYMDANGLVVTGSADSPRFDHRYVNGEVESLGLLVEERRINVLLYSEEFDSWSKNNSSVTANATTAPDGTTTADKLVENSSTGNKEVYQNATFTSGTSLTFSCFAKAGERTRFRLAGTTERFDSSTNAYFDLSNGTVVTTNGGFTSASIEAYPNGWYRCVGTMLPTSSGTNNVFITLVNTGTTTGYTGDGSSGVFIWGAQLEEGHFPTSYIPTSDSTVTRNHDRAYYENVDQTDWFSKTEGTVVFEHTDVPYNSSDDPHYPAVGFGETAGGGSNPSIQYFIMKHNGNGQYLVRPGGGDSANVTPSGVVASASKVGFAYKEDDFPLVRNGSLVGNDTSGVVPAAYMLILGMNTTSNTGNNWNAHLKNLQYYPTRLSNAVLQNLTK